MERCKMAMAGLWRVHGGPLRAPWRVNGEVMERHGGSMGTMSGPWSAAEGRSSVMEGLWWVHGDPLRVHGM